MTSKVNINLNKNTPQGRNLENNKVGAFGNW